MTLKIKMPELPKHFLVKDISPLSVVRDVLTNDLYLVGTQDDGWDDGADKDKELVPVMVLSSAKDPLGSIQEIDPNTKVFKEEAELKVNGSEKATFRNTLTNEEFNLIAHGQKIQAIKLVRQRLGLGLKDAKEFVDREQSRAQHSI